MAVIENTNVINDDLSIALCTCEGSLFLPRQLDSLAGQSVLPGEVVVCDDASKDDTVNIVKEYAKIVPFKVQTRINELRLGAVKNFEQANILCGGKYVALCDQDDIWLPEKLELTVQKMKQAEKYYEADTPVLIYSDLSVIDETGSLIAPSFMKYRRIKPEPAEPLKALLAQNFVTGCTVLINRPLIEMALPIPESAVMHDWWLALVAAATGRIIYEPTPTVLYRKHGKNVVGPKSFFDRENLSRLLKVESMENELAGTISQVAALQDRLKLLGMAERYPYINHYLEAVSHGGIKALSGAIKAGVKKTGLVRNLLFCLLLLKGRYKHELLDRNDL